jgi:hypothetical protein
MCMACEEQAMMWRYELEMAVLRGEMPPGFEPADFEAAGLPVPGRAQPEAHPASKPANSFVCESPDDE